ncbi:hypothetical protein DPMN_055123 [Dreissena polymorpha]|uniref:Uncharacterized protein n=1 Tax=Dreissena polymorpha TaxID=45954 RepID=A0A9D4HRY9_DREPO|nr:hypothetical protein DPMN_055123 [Dreissena polymorpha]
MPRRSPGECRWRPGRAPVYLGTIDIPGLCRNSPGLHRQKPGRCRSSDGVCIGPCGATVPSRLFSVQSRLLPVPRRSLTVLPDDSRSIPEVLNILIFSQWSPGYSRSSPVHLGRSRFIPIQPQFIPVDPGSRTRAPPAS